MGLHFIKNGTKHDVCVKRPSLFPASDTTYDNSSSGLSATRVQGAIDEVAGRTDFEIIKLTLTCSANSSALGGYYGYVNKADVPELAGKKILAVWGQNTAGFPCPACYLPDEAGEPIRISSNDIGYYNTSYVYCLVIPS